MKLLVLTCVSVMALSLNAQTYPAALLTAFTGDKTLFLDEFADPFHPRIRTSIYFTDFNQASWKFSLRLTIKGPGGIRLQSVQDLRPDFPIEVFAGQVKVLEGADLAWFFDPSHLEFTGIDKLQFQKTKRLPEGQYTFCFDAVDYETGKLLSLPSCSSAWLSLNDPPIAISPVNGSVIENTALPSVFFQWQLSNITAGLDPAKISYVFKIYEVLNNWTNPSSAILNNQALPIWESPPQSHNFLVYGLSEPPLVRGHRYVYTISSSSNDGRERFKNNGVSAPTYFHYGYYEGDTLQIIKPEDQFQFTLSTPSQFKWRKPLHALPSQQISYTLRLVEVGPNQTPSAAMANNAAFYQQEYLPVNSAVLDKTIPVMFWMNIRRMGQYAWQVVARSGWQEVARSPVQVFTGPPAIESFIAGGFLMSVTRLTAFDTVTHFASGKCKTVLNPSWNRMSEFAFTNIKLSPLGANEWVMINGSIRDAIGSGSFVLSPDSLADNGKASFVADSIVVDVSNLRLSGEVVWQLPHPVNADLAGEVRTRRAQLVLANSSFYLSSGSGIPLRQFYTFGLIDPAGFSLRLDQRSQFTVYQSRYKVCFNGFLETGNSTISKKNRKTNFHFQNAAQLFYIQEKENEFSESIFPTRHCEMEIQPISYLIDLSERRSGAEFSADTIWKGVLLEKAKLIFPQKLENSAQLRLPLARSYTLINLPGDSISNHVSAGGLFFKSSISFSDRDTLKLNNFPCRNASFRLQVERSQIRAGGINGEIIIPLLDTLNGFPFQLELKEEGFGEAYVLAGLAGKSFTFNVAGAAEQQVPILIQRAVFKGRNRIELDVDLSWPAFSLQIPNVQALCVWGNGNIGFDVPNGKSALTYQCKGLANKFDITVDEIGCGRNGNAYVFGASAKINLDEEISGETGPPVINAYSICRNPLLSGSITTSSQITNSVSVGSNTLNNGSAYSSGTSSYSLAALQGLNDILVSRGISNLDSLAGPDIKEEETHHAILKTETVLQVREMLAIIIRMRPFIKSSSISNRDWMVLDKLQTVLNSELVNQAQLGNGKDLLNFVFNKAIESLITLLNSKIQGLSDLAIDKVHEAVFDKITDPINKKIDKSLSSVFAALQTKILSQIDSSYHAVVKSSIKAVNKELAAGINRSVKNSFEKNIFSKFTGIIEIGVTGEVKKYIRNEISVAAHVLVKEGSKAKINLGDFVDHAETLLVNIADTIRDAILTLNGRNFVNTAESLVEDAVYDIDWNAIALNIMKDLGVKGVSQAIAGQVSQIFGKEAGPFVMAVLNTVKFDFTNLGDKLKNGQFDKIVKFDPTTIYLVTPAVDIRGTLRFKKDDAEFGDSWQGDVFVKVKVPKKDNALESSAFFLNGKTGASAGNYTYWFTRLAASGFSIPLSPAPVIWDGVEGYAFSKMKMNAALKVYPDPTNKFGIGARFKFYDQQSSGRSYVFDLGADANFNEGGFAIALNGNVSLLNTIKQNGKYKAPGFITGTASMGYYQTPTQRKIAASLNVQFQTSPLLCAGGEAGMDLQTPANWRVWIGSKEKPIGVKILCKDFLSNSAYLEASQSGFKADLSMNIDLKIRSAWIETNQFKFRGFSNFKLGYSAQTSVEWEPDFRLNDASFSAWVLADLGLDYEISGSTGQLVLAGVALSGQLSYKSQPDAELKGELAGNIKLAGYALTFKAPVKYSLSKQAILD